MREKCLKTETFKVKMIVFTRALLYSLLYMWQFPVFRRDTDIPMHVLTPMLSMDRNEGFLNGPTPVYFWFIFGRFKQTIQFLKQFNVKMLRPV